MSEPSPFDPDSEPFESLLEKLGDVVARLESGELSLESALTVFERGVVLARAGSRRLDEAERRVEQLLAEGDRVETRPLHPNEIVE